MSLTKISASPATLPETTSPAAVCTLTFTAFVMTPNSLITSSGLWPEKMCTSAFQSIVRVWLSCLFSCGPPAASARLSSSALPAMRVIWFVVLTYSARWSSVDAPGTSPVGWRSFALPLLRGPAVIWTVGLAMTFDTSVVVLFAVDERKPNRPVTLAYEYA